MSRKTNNLKKRLRIDRERYAKLDREADGIATKAQSRERELRQALYDFHKPYLDMEHRRYVVSVEFDPALLVRSNCSPQIVADDVACRVAQVVRDMASPVRNFGTMAGFPGLIRNQYGAITPSLS